MSSNNSSDLYEHFDFTASSGQEPLRVGKFLMNFIDNATRNKIQKAAVNGNILVNNLPVKSSYKEKSGDRVSIVYSYPKQTNELIPQDIPINITYEDDDILIVNKEAGMVVHPGFGNYDGTLVNALAYHFDNLPKKSSENRPGLVHRIDKNTSGILVIAKNEDSMTILSKKFEKRDLNRLYVALVWGDLKEDSGFIEGNIGRSLKNRKIMSVFADGEYGKYAKTNYKVLERFGYVTMVECKLETGRTHQIRVHMSNKGNNILGDKKYKKKFKKFKNIEPKLENLINKLDRQFLHAKALGFIHPTTGKEIQFTSILPQELEKILKMLRNTNK